MSIEIVIDPNVRVEGNRTYAGFEDVLGGFVSDLHPGDHVTVVEEESDVVGDATIYSVDIGTQLIYLTVEWKTLRRRSPESQSARAKEWRPLVKAYYVTPSGTALESATVGIEAEVASAS
jgi:hypothetical protein